MATTVITGRDLSLTIDSDDYNDQCQSFTLTLENQQEEYDVLAGTTYKTIKVTGTLDVEMLADWGADSSLCEALFNAANSAPDTGISFSADANGATFTGDVFPAFPSAGGTAPDAVTASVSLKIVDGSVTLA
jgi:hypothetical protein